MLDAKIVIMDSTLWKNRTADLRKANEASRTKDEEIQKQLQDNGSNPNTLISKGDKKISATKGTTITTSSSSSVNPNRPRMLDVSQLLDVKVVFGLEEEKNSSKHSNSGNTNSSNGFNGNRNGNGSTIHEDVASSPWAMRKRNIAGAAAVARQESLSSPNTPIRSSSSTSMQQQQPQQRPSRSTGVANTNKHDNSTSLRSNRALSFDASITNATLGPRGKVSTSSRNGTTTTTSNGASDWDKIKGQRSSSASSSSLSQTTATTGKTNKGSSSLVSTTNTTGTTDTNVVLAPQFREISPKLLSNYDTNITNQWKTIFDNGNVPTGIQQKRKRTRQEYFQVQRQHIAKMINAGNGILTSSTSTNNNSNGNGYVNENTIFYPAVGTTIVPGVYADTWWYTEYQRFPWLMYPDQRIHPVPETIPKNSLHDGYNMQYDNDDEYDNIGDKDDNNNNDDGMEDTPRIRQYRCPRRDWDYEYYGNLLHCRPSLRSITAEGYMDGYSIRNAWISAIQTGTGGGSGGSASVSSLQGLSTSMNGNIKKKKGSNVSASQITESALSKQLSSKLRISTTNSVHQQQQQEAHHQRRLERGSYGNGTGNINDEYDYDYHNIDSKKRYGKNGYGSTSSTGHHGTKGQVSTYATSPFVLSPVHGNTHSYTNYETKASKMTTKDSQKYTKKLKNKQNATDNDDEEDAVMMMDGNNNDDDDGFTFTEDDDTRRSVVLPPSLQRTHHRLSTVSVPNVPELASIGKFYKTASIPPTLPKNSKQSLTRVHLRIAKKSLAAPVYAIGVQRSALQSGKGNNGSNSSSSINSSKININKVTVTLPSRTSKTSSSSSTNTHNNVGSNHYLSSSYDSSTTAVRNFTRSNTANSTSSSNSNGGTTTRSGGGVISSLLGRFFGRK